MRLFTSQHKSILEKINREGIYIPTGEYSNYNNNEAYNLLIKEFKSYPIFCLNSYEGQKLSYNFIKKNFVDIKYLIPFQKDNLIFEIEKPISECLLTDYYNWVDVLYYYKDACEDEKIELKEFGCDKLSHALNLRQNCSIQVLIKDIKMTDIKNIYLLEDFKK